MNRAERRKLFKGRAKEIVKLEIECQRGINFEANQLKIAELVSQLTTDEMLALDDYIMTHYKLTK